MSRSEHHSHHKKNNIWKWVLGILIALVLVVIGVGAKVFYDTKHTMDGIQQEVSATNSANVDLKKSTPVSILLLGVDDGDGRAKGSGRSDSMMVVALNPKDKKSALVSIERDSYVNIVGYGAKDKLNSAYAYGGTSMAVKTVEQLLNIPINFYVTMNMDGLEELVNAVGGVTVNSKFAFSYGGYQFKKGENTLNGKQALAFTRMRYDDPEGDYGRQYRQREVVQAVMKKILSMHSITNYKAVLNAVKNNMKTDITWNDMLLLAKNYAKCSKNVKSDYLHGKGFTQNGISYQDVSGDLPRIQQLLQSYLNE